jgi:uncharacterized protein (DUF983 family)
MAGGPNPFLTGLACRCPKCGEGHLFAGFLKVADRCEACGLDLAAADSGDGPVVFILLFVGMIVVFSMLIVEFTVHPPIWVHLVIWLPLTVIVCLALLRPFKGVLLAAQFMNKASQARHDD